MEGSILLSARWGRSVVVDLHFGGYFKLWSQFQSLCRERTLRTCTFEDMLCIPWYGLRLRLREIAKPQHVIRLAGYVP